MASGGVPYSSVAEKACRHVVRSNLALNNGRGFLFSTATLSEAHCEGIILVIISRVFMVRLGTYNIGSPVV